MRAVSNSKLIIKEYNRVYIFDEISTITAEM